MGCQASYDDDDLIYISDGSIIIFAEKMRDLHACVREKRLKSSPSESEKLATFLESWWRFMSQNGSIW